MNIKSTEFMLANLETNPAVRDFRRQVFLDDLMMFKESDEFVKYITDYMDKNFETPNFYKVKDAKEIKVTVL